jgi:hypothetical protein
MDTAGRWAVAGRRSAADGARAEWTASARWQDRNAYTLLAWMRKPRAGTGDDKRTPAGHFQEYSCLIQT